MNDTVQNRATLSRLRGMLALLRPRQWVKNGFVLAPLIFSGMFLDMPSIQRALLAALVFCAASSAVYIVNDMNDVEADRRHPIKRHKRPLASGAVSKGTALVMLVCLYIVVAAASLVSVPVGLVVSGYIVLNLAYTFFLKQQPVVDIFCIAIGFVLRVYAGAVALSVPVSSWMFVTTLCLALYLASVKRRQELNKSGATGRSVLRHYSVALVDRYAEMSATGALIFYSLFVISDHNELVVTIPLVLFGLFRYWFLVESLDEGESPTDALLSDWQLLAVIVAWVGICAWVVWPVASR